MLGSIQRKPEQLNATKVSSYRIIRKYKRLQFGLSTVEWAVAIHGNNGISDNEMGPDGCADVENTFVDSGPMKDILRPAVECPSLGRNPRKYSRHRSEEHTSELQSLTTLVIRPPPDKKKQTNE